MILIGLFIVMILLGFIILKCNIGEDPDLVGWIIIMLGLVFLIISLLIIIAVHVTANNRIQKNRIQYEGLCKRYQVIKSGYEDVSKSDVIADITAWNMEVYNTKYWSENPWTNWFNPRKIADNLYYIPLDTESEDTILGKPIDCPLRTESEVEE